MINIKLIKTEKEYEGALKRIDGLMDAKPGSPEEDELELLSLLVEKYEEEHFPIGLPDPVEAILFRMEQEGLEPKDLIPYLGSQSKVSEVLNYKRPLSLSMIRSLQEGLGIPAEVLIQKPAHPAASLSTPETHSLFQEDVHFSCPNIIRERQINDLYQWQEKTAEKAIYKKLPLFEPDKADLALFKELARLSSYSAGPQMACELLNKKGIHLIVLKMAFRIDFDGACFFTSQQRPVIALTLQNDQLVDFWFVLFHLLAHLYLHRVENKKIFFDSIDCVFDKKAPSEERQVNKLLEKALAPPTGLRKVILSYVITGDEKSLNTVIQTGETSPEVLTCWLRLKNEDANETPIPLSPKKVSEKLEVYSYL